MVESSSPTSCGSTPAGHPRLRSRINEALANYLRSHRPVDVAEALGVARSTISRDRDQENIEQWRTGESLALGVADRGIGLAMIAFLLGEHRGHAEAVDATCQEALVDLSHLLAAIAERLRSGHHVDLRESQDLLPMVIDAESLLGLLRSNLTDQIERKAP